MSESSKVLEIALILVGFEISYLTRQLTHESNNAARYRFALKMLSAWSGREGQYDGEVVGVVSEWVKAGMIGPVPWPSNPFFEQWAKQQGWSNIGGYVGIV